MIVFVVVGLVLIVLGIALSPWWLVVGGMFLPAALRVEGTVASDTARMDLLVFSD